MAREMPMMEANRGLHDMLDRETAAQLIQENITLKHQAMISKIKGNKASTDERRDIADWLCDEGHEELGLAVLDEKYKEQNR